jgi:hypothetical protein
MANAATITPGFFHKFGITLVRGRDFDWTDGGDHLMDPVHVAILSRSLAVRLFPSGNALGQRIRFSFMPDTQNLEVVGVADNARLLDLHDPDSAVIYLPCNQAPWLFLFVRTRRAPGTLARTVENEINSLGRDYVLGAKTMDEEISQALVEDRAVVTLSSFFGGLALLLASIGLYGLISYSVSRSPGDLPTIVAVSLLLCASALFASYLPARRASRTDPMVALRYQ